MGERKELATVEKCETCRFWDNSKTEERFGGSCHRYPPKINGGFKPQWEEGEAELLHSLFPSTMGSEWCGEYQQKTVATPAPGV